VNAVILMGEFSHDCGQEYETLTHLATGIISCRLPLLTATAPTSGVATGSISVYIPPPPKKKKKNSVQLDFLWGKNDLKTAIGHEY